MPRPLPFFPELHLYGRGELWTAVLLNHNDDSQILHHPRLSPPVWQHAGRSAMGRGDPRVPGSRVRQLH